MKIYRDKFVYIVPEKDYEVAKIETTLNDLCIYNNPKFDEIFNRNKFRRIWEYKKEPKNYITFDKVLYQGVQAYKIHKGNYPVLKKLAEEFAFEIVDNRINWKIECRLTVEPRDEEQKKAIKAIMNHLYGFGILSSPPASGKTYIASNLITKFKQRTLVVVDQKLLSHQFKTSIINFTDIKEEEIGLIDSETKDYSHDKKVIIATMQTLCKNPNIMKSLYKNIGFLILDECQIASCDSIQTIMKEFNPSRILGLSGTPYRDDDMDFLMKEALGPIIYTTSKEALIAQGSIVMPILRPVFIRNDKIFYKNLQEETEFRDVVNEHYLNEDNIKVICKNIIKNIHRSQLVICKEKSIVDVYYRNLVLTLHPDIQKKYQRFRNHFKQIDKYNQNRPKGKKRKKYKYKKVNTDEPDFFKLKKDIKRLLVPEIITMTGSDSQLEKDRIISDTKKNKIKIILTTTVMDKAISIDRLDTVHMLFSTKERVNTYQRATRIARTFPGKKDAIIFDYIYDHYIPFYQFYNKNGKCRLSAYKDFAKIHVSIKDFIDFLQKRYVSKDNTLTTPEYEKIKRLYELKASEYEED